MTAQQGFALHPLAAQDITEVWEYIAADNPLAARRVREEIFGLSPATLRRWENGERQPTGAARIRLTIISREPEAALRAIR